MIKLPKYLLPILIAICLQSQYALYVHRVVNRNIQQTFAIDPLDEDALKVSKSRKPRPNKRTIINKDDIPVVSIDSTNKSPSFISTDVSSFVLLNSSAVYLTSKDSYIDLNSENIILICYLEFLQISRQYASRLGFISFLVNSLILVPLLPLLKYKLGLSVIPFLFSGLFTFILPYILLFLWEVDIYRAEFITSYLRKYIALINSTKGASSEQLDPSRLTDSKGQYERLLCELDSDVVLERVLSLRPRNMRARPKKLPA